LSPKAVKVVSGYPNLNKVNKERNQHTPSLIKAQASIEADRSQIKITVGQFTPSKNIKIQA
jgi:hypothetical protein